MKIVLVHIVRGKANQPQMVYPDRYNAVEVDRSGLGPLNVNGAGAYSGHIGRGGDEEWCIVLLEDALAEEYTAEDGMEIITADTADALMEEWRVANHEPEVVVNAPDRIQAIRVKLDAGLKLSESDMHALDPDDPEPGVSKRLRSMHSILADVPKLGRGPGAGLGPRRRPQPR